MADSQPYQLVVTDPVVAEALEQWVDSARNWENYNEYGTETHLQKFHVEEDREYTLKSLAGAELGIDIWKDEE